VINSNLGPILYHLDTIHPLQMDEQTDRQTDDNHDKGPTFSLVLSNWPKK